MPDATAALVFVLLALVLITLENNATLITSKLKHLNWKNKKSAENRGDNSRKEIFKFINL